MLLVSPVTAQAPTLAMAKEHLARQAKKLQESDVFKDYQAAKVWVDSLEKEEKAKAERKDEPKP